MVAMDKSRRVETWTSEIDALRQNVERKKLITEKTEKEIINFELDNGEMTENIKLLNGQLSVLNKAGFKSTILIPTTLEGRYRDKLLDKKPQALYLSNFR